MANEGIRGNISGSGKANNGPIKPSSTSKKTNSSSRDLSKLDPTKLSENEELALSGRYGFQQDAQRETVDNNYYNRVQISVSQDKTADARTEMPGIYAQIQQINSKNSYDIPGSKDSNTFDDYDDDNSFGVSLFS